MERLTKSARLAGHEVNFVSDVDCFDVWSTPKKFMGAAIDRLAAYEDTGLEPEDLKKAFNEDSVLKLAGQCLGMKPDRLCELARAEKDGRLVVLPCKVGGTAWVKDRAGVPREMRLEAPDIRFVCTDEDNLCMSLCNRTQNGLCAYRIKNDGSDLGTKILLTREEAEAALEGGRDNGQI